MRFLARILTAVMLAATVGNVMGDLRFATTPRRNFQVINGQNSIPFVTRTQLYMEPSTFGYDGLEEEKKQNYDNFLRSNIDNEQDERNFVREAGRDHLPFRTDEGASRGQAMVMTIGEESIIPLRWNNPHSSECELNVWIAGNRVVVPIKRPVCCGEGYQDAVISAKLPADFNQLASKVPGFNGCLKVGDCTLQLYAHSVEPRTYAVGVPLIVRGGVDPTTVPKATSDAAIAPATTDPGTDLSKLANPLCLPTGSPAADVATAQPRFARFVSDVANHAYQNSDFSPYSGQQHESISRNLQAAAILRMTVGNRGELGKSTLTREQTQLLNNARNKVDQIVDRYERTANNIIGRIQNQVAKGGQVGDQRLANCFRCDVVGSVDSGRQQTDTYIPSFNVPAASAAGIRDDLQRDRKTLMAGNTVQIYVGVMQNDEVEKLFRDLACAGLVYQGPCVKQSIATAGSPTQHRKLQADNKTRDQGQYAATSAYTSGLATGIQRAPAGCPRN